MTEISTRIAIMGLSHRHAYGMTEQLIEAGATISNYLDDGETDIIAGFQKRFPRVPHASSQQEIFDDQSISAVIIVAEPSRRATMAIEAMRNGKDVMVDKPGCLTLEELDEIRDVVRETGRIWSVNFSERFEVRAVTKATQMVRDGCIGKVIQTTGIGPHRLNAGTRPDWFFNSSNYGGILTDIGSHQIDQFLHFTGLENAQITHASVENYATPEHPEFEDFGEINLRGDGASAYIRLDWFTPDALPNWGDGRLFILGDQGYIELRKYVDLASHSGTDHLYFCNQTDSGYINCSQEDLPYFGQFLSDVNTREETACPQAHTFLVCKLAIEAQNLALSRRIT